MISKSGIGIVAFGAGLVMGSALGYFTSKQKHAKERDEAINKIRNIWYEDNLQNDADAKEEYSKIVNVYTNDIPENRECYSEISNKNDSLDIFDDEVESKKTVKDIFIISPDEFNENPEFDSSTLWYYENDDILVDESNNIIKSDDIYKYIIPDFRNHIGEYEEDCLHIRNGILRTDFEIICTDNDISSVISHKNGLNDNE